MESTRTTQFIITIIVLLAASALTATFATVKPSRYTKIYAFGDSYTDTGNTVSTTGPSGFNFVSSLPYGMTYFHHPTNRYSDGRLIIDFVAQSLNLPFLPPFKNFINSTNTPNSSVNFAVAGATAIPYSYFKKNNMTIDITPQSINTQFEWLTQYLQKTNTTTTFFNDTLFWVGEIGANDYAYSAFQTTIPRNKIQNLVIGNISKFVHSLLKTGAKHLFIQGLPPTGCLTLSLTLSSKQDRDAMGCAATANNQSSKHNTLLRNKLANLSKRFPDANIVYIDYWNAYVTVLNNPGRFGLTQKFKACCGAGGGEYNYELFKACGSESATACPNPKEYVNWDGVHLTEAMYKAVSGLILNTTLKL